MPRGIKAPIGKKLSKLLSTPRMDELSTYQEYVELRRYTEKMIGIFSEQLDAYDERVEKALYECKCESVCRCRDKVDKASLVVCMDKLSEYIVSLVEVAKITTKVNGRNKLMLDSLELCRSIVEVLEERGEGEAKKTIDREIKGLLEWVK